ncbi:MAG: hypothetical protein AAF497_02025, partial [Planctomycetota bacterium]
GQVLEEPAGQVDLLPTICGLLGIESPKNVALDGASLAPLLTDRRGEFERDQPLFWLLPTSGPVAAVRDGDYVLTCNRDYKFPRDYEAMARIKKEIENLLRKKGSFEEEVRGSTLRKQMFEGFKDQQAEKLRGQFIRLNMFNESWIPTIRKGGYRQFQLFDLKRDPGQSKDVSERFPDIVRRLKEQFLEINASVMADAVDWR